MEATIMIVNTNMGTHTNIFHTFFPTTTQDIFVELITEDMVLAMVHMVLALVHIILDMEGTVDMGMVLKAMRNRLKHMLSNQVIKLSPNHMHSHKYTLKLKAMLNLKRTLSLNNRTLKHNHIVRRKHTSLNNRSLSLNNRT